MLRFALTNHEAGVVWWIPAIRVSSPSPTNFQSPTPGADPILGNVGYALKATAELGEAPLLLMLKQFLCVGPTNMQLLGSTLASYTETSPLCCATVVFHLCRFTAISIEPYGYYPPYQRSRLLTVTVHHHFVSNQSVKRP